MMARRKLLWHVYPYYLVVIVASLLAVSLYASFEVKRAYLEDIALQLEARAKLIDAQLIPISLAGDSGELNTLVVRLGQQSSTRITIIDVAGVVLADSDEDPIAMENHRLRPEFAEALAGRKGMDSRLSNTLQKQMMYVAVPLKRHDGIVGVLRISTPLTPIDRAVEEIQTQILIGGILIPILAAISCLLVSRRITRPIEEIKQSAECFSRGEFHCRLPSFESEEIGSLSETMNQMAGELSERIETITRQRNELEVVFSSMLEGVLAIDASERIMSMNEAAAEFFECDPKQAQGRSVQEVIRNVDLQDFVKRALSCQGLIEQDILFHTPIEGVLNAHGNALYDTEGTNIGALIVFSDVTRLRQLETVRRDFVANVSHEIKTPITAIKGFVQTLRDGAINEPENRGRFLEIIENQVDRLSFIIEDLLSLSRIEEDAKKEEIVLQPGSIEGVLATAIQLCEAKAVAKKIKLELSCEADLEAKINPALLEQAVVNLLDNAVKYSEAKSTVRLEAGKEDSEIVIHVKDHGCGIEKRHLERLFERFYRVDKARSRKLGGTGLGLAIVKHITRAHHGYVTVASVPHEGSTFSLHLPEPPE